MVETLTDRAGEIVRGSELLGKHSTCSNIEDNHCNYMLSGDSEDCVSCGLYDFKLQQS